MKPKDVTINGKQRVVFLKEAARFSTTRRYYQGLDLSEYSDFGELLCTIAECSGGIKRFEWDYIKKKGKIVVRSGNIAREYGLKDYYTTWDEFEQKYGKQLTDKLKKGEVITLQNGDSLRVWDFILLKKKVKKADLLYVESEAGYVGGNAIEVFLAKERLNIRISGNTLKFDVVTHDMTYTNELSDELYNNAKEIPLENDGIRYRIIHVEDVGDIDYTNPNHKLYTCKFRLECKKI